MNADINTGVTSELPALLGDFEDMHLGIEDREIRERGIGPRLEIFYWVYQ